MISFNFKQYLVYLFSIFLISCSFKTKQDLNNSNSTKKNYSIEKKADCFILSIKEVFHNSGISESYCLCPEGKNISAENFTQTIKIPVEKVGINSTTHIGFISVLDKLKSIKAATSLSLFYNQDFNDRIDKGEVQSLGISRIEKELLIDQELDVLFTYAIDAASYNEVEKLRSLGQNVVLINEFIEENPINKANWLEVIALFYGENEVTKAKHYLNNIEMQYFSLKEIAKDAINKPKVMLGMPWKGNWYISGVNTYQANFISDAGANYQWEELVDYGSLPVAIEKVLVNSIDADFWLNPGSYKNKRDILELDERFNKINAFEESSIYSHYNRSNLKGANDYWESGVVEPNVILADLIYIFHPSLLQEHKSKYYFRIDE